jgi:hypothetical protein
MLESVAYNVAKWATFVADIPDSGSVSNAPLN